ncbi:hypothetical protein GCM10022222_09570 [Amycolatopsis ultiminotia]|uniref:Uncharacterized protein n=1 Tax=Amycolatopsis ultiminotia TaxID=543629 RepID=A0ABP6V4G2_9PSEU
MSLQHDIFSTPQALRSLSTTRVSTSAELRGSTPEIGSLRSQIACHRPLRTQAPAVEETVGPAQPDRAGDHGAQVLVVWLRPAQPERSASEFIAALADFADRLGESGFFAGCLGFEVGLPHHFRTLGVVPAFHTVAGFAAITRVSATRIAILRTRRAVAAKRYERPRAGPKGCLVTRCLTDWVVG